MFEAEELYRSPNALAAHYTRFRVAERLLLTGHSHQAWPDRAFDGQCRAWLDAAEAVDDKWERAFARADRVRAGYAQLLEDRDGHIALAESTHELVIRFLSALPLASRPRIVTTDGEFHSLRRQLARLAEEGLEVVRVPAEPAREVAGRLVDALDERTAAVMVSCVLFRSAQIVPGLGAVLEACRRKGAELLVDSYHALNVVPFSLREERLEGAYVVGGGYKYMQLGEGNAFLRAPADCTLRPVVTGWFSEFWSKAGAQEAGRVAYGEGPARFAGATYEPTGNYRGAEVLDFFAEHALSAPFLREVSQHQIGLLARRFDELDLDPQLIDRDRTLGIENLGGFLALRAPHASELQTRLFEAGVWTDSRDEVLRFGPAPYLSDEQLEESMAILGRVARAL